MGRMAGIDYGTRRIGLAISDPGGTIASPAGVLGGAGDPESDARRVLKWAAEHDLDSFVVGLPVNMNGTEGPQAALTRRFSDALAVLGATVVHWDERLSTFQAGEWLRESGLSAAKRKKILDALAAKAILQAYLDAQQRDPVAGGDDATSG